MSSGCGCKEAYTYIDFLILIIPTPLVSALFYSIPTFCSFSLSNAYSTSKCPMPVFQITGRIIYAYRRHLEIRFKINQFPFQV